MYGLVRERLEAFGYQFKKDDEGLLKASVGRAQRNVSNECNLYDIPEELLDVVIDMAAGEFLAVKKVVCPQDIDCVDLNAAVKRIEVGDTNTIFAVGEGSLTDEQRFDRFVEYLLNYGRAQFNCFRRVKW
ncbi:MAG: hypothetical protein HDT44_07320 [Ruminococcaceae bacterium]|nr:hypothetical protein [Oscillospiraceae bacterium]